MQCRFSAGRAHGRRNHLTTAAQRVDTLALCARAAALDEVLLDDTALVRRPSTARPRAGVTCTPFRVRFAPDSLADYDDFVVVQTGKESYPLPLAR
jgi:hypothetical protein